ESAQCSAVTREVLERGAQTGGASALRPITIAGCPPEDDADRVVLEMLGRVLDLTGRTVQTGPAGMLSVETLATRPQLICLSSIEGGGRLRDLVERLSRARPDGPLLG